MLAGSGRRARGYPLAAGCVLLARVACMLFVLSQPSVRPPMVPGAWPRTGGDTDSYILACENLLATGSYHPDFRMPGYAMAYVPLRLVLDQAAALNVLMVLQLLLSVVAVLALGELAALAWPARAVACRRLAIVAYAASTYTAIFDAYLLTESLATSSVTIGILLFLRARASGSLGVTLAAGALLGWAVFLRPIMLGLLLLALLAIVGFRASLPFRGRLVQAAVLVGPFVVADAAWAARNFVQRGVAEPLTPIWAPYYSALDLSLNRFLQSWGGSVVYWNPRAEIVWFEHLDSPAYRISPAAIARIEFPADIYTSRFDYATLVALKERLRQARGPGMPPAERRARIAAVARDLDEFAASVRREKPLVYWVLGPLRLTRNLLVHSGTYNLHAKPVDELTLGALAFKVGMSGLYWWVLTFGFAGIVLVLRRERHPLGDGSFLALAVVYMITAHTVVARLDEYRYFVPAYPLLLCLAACATVRARDAVQGQAEGGGAVPAPSRPKFA
jgi:hypothetical protein